MGNLFGSFYARVLGIFLLTGILLLMVVLSTWRWVIHEGDHHPLRPVAISHLKYMVNDIGVPPDLEKAKYITENIPLRIAIRGPKLHWSSDPQFMDFREDPQWLKQREPSILRYHGQRFAMYPQGDYRFYVSWQHRFFQPKDKYKLIVGLMLVLGLLWLSYLATQRLLRPVRDVSETAMRIKSGDLDYRVQKCYSGELGELCTNVNGMADKLQDLIEAKRQLLLAISHELRSPITRAKVNSEFIDSDKTKHRIVADLNEMEALVGTLIESERLNQPHVILNREVVDITTLVKKVAAVWPDAKLQLALPESPATTKVDPVRFELMLRNVIANAVRYGKNKPITISLLQSQGKWQLQIKDQGDGIPADHLQHIAEPFYRPDDSRQRQTGGFGLGLYLAKRIIEAHGGELRIHSDTGALNTESGTTVTFLWD